MKSPTETAKAIVDALLECGEVNDYAVLRYVFDSVSDQVRDDFVDHIANEYDLVEAEEDDDPEDGSRDSHE